MLGKKNSVSNGSANSLHLIIGMYDVVFFVYNKEVVVRVQWTISHGRAD